MGKAGSTFLQDWFAGQPEVFSLRAETPLCETICQLGLEYVRSGAELDEASLAKLSSFQATVADGSRIPVLSEERFSAWQGGVLEHPKADELASFRLIVCKIVKAIFPEAKILLITRGYEDLLRSSYSQYVSSGGARSFARFLQEQRSYRLVAMRFDALVEHYGKFFSPTDIKLLPFELLRADRHQFVDEVARFIGMDHVAEISSTPVNPSIGRSQMRLLRHMSDLAERSLRDEADLADYRKMLRKLVTACTSSEDPVIRAKLDLIGRKIPRELLDIPESYFDELRGVASIVSGDPLYDRYRAQYLI